MTLVISTTTVVPTENDSNVGSCTTWATTGRWPKN